MLKGTGSTLLPLRLARGAFGEALKMNWNDPTFLRSASAVIQWLVIALASIAVCLQTAKHFVDLREKRINSALAAARDEAQKLRELGLQQKLDASEKRIRSLALRITFEAFAKWKGGKPPNPGEFISIGSAEWFVQLKLIFRGGEAVNVEFRNDEAITYRPLSDGVTEVSYWVTAAPGSKVFALLADDVELVRDVKFTCIGFNADALAEPSITIGSLKLLFAVNGGEAFASSVDIKQRVEPDGKSDSDYRLGLVRDLKVTHR